MKTIEEIIAEFVAAPDRDRRDRDQPSPSAIIPLLQATQKERGYVPEEAIRGISRALRVPRSTVYGVATFYNQFRLTPLGEHVVEICRGTACHVKGSGKLCDHLRRKLKLQKDGNSRDGKFTLLTPACLGACSIASVVRVDGEFHGGMDVAKLDALLDQLK